MGTEELRTCIHWDFATCCPPREDFLSIIRNIYLAMSKTLNVTNQFILKINNVFYCYGDFFSDTLAFFYPLIAHRFHVRCTFVKSPEKFAGKINFGMKEFAQGLPPPANLMVITGNPHVFPLLEKFRQQGYNISCCISCLGLVKSFSRRACQRDEHPTPH